MPTFEGGSIHGVLPRVRLIEGLNQKGLFTYGGRPKPAVGSVAQLYRALGSGVESPVLQMRRGADQHGVEGHPA